MEKRKRSFELGQRGRNGGCGTPLQPRLSPWLPLKAASCCRSAREEVYRMPCLEEEEKKRTGLGTEGECDKVEKAN